MQVSEDVVRRVQGRLGQVLSSRWKLERVLGIGGVAAVYEAVHRNQNRVAIKILHPEQVANTVVSSRFVHEGYVANSVDHRGAVKVVDDGVDEQGCPFLVMELLEGETLDDRQWRHGGKLPAGEVLALADQVLDVLCAAHDKQIVHRDIKPDNLFLTNEGRVKVLDFGIARLAEASQGVPGTLAGTLMGTPSFMAPEQARSRWEDVDARSDVFSLGATMFTLLTGTQVHDAETVTEQLALAVNTPAPKVRDRMPDAAPVVAALIDRALEFDKASRWASARVMQIAVHEALQEVPPPRTFSLSSADAPRPSPKPRSKASIQGADTMVAPVLDSRAREGAADAVSVGRAHSSFITAKVAVGLVLGLLAAGYVVVTLAMRRAPETALPETTEPPRAAASAPLPTPEASQSSERVEVPTPSAAPPAGALPSAPIPKPIRAAAPPKPRSAPPPARPPPSPNSDDPFAKRY